MATAYHRPGRPRLLSGAQSTHSRLVLDLPGPFASPLDHRPHSSRRTRDNAKGQPVPKLDGCATAWDVDSGTGNGTALGDFLSGFGCSKRGAEIGHFRDVSIGSEGRSCDGPPEASGFSP